MSAQISEPTCEQFLGRLDIKDVMTQLDDAFDVTRVVAQEKYGLQVHYVPHSEGFSRQDLEELMPSDIDYASMTEPQVIAPFLSDEYKQRVTTLLDSSLGDIARVSGYDHHVVRGTETEVVEIVSAPAAEFLAGAMSNIFGISATNGHLEIVPVHDRDLSHNDNLTGEEIFSGLE